MSRDMFEPIFKSSFPFWESISEKDKDFLCENTVAMSYPKGTSLHNGEGCSGVFLVKKGCLRVYIMSEDGKDVTLYRLHDGDMCMLAASCVLRAVTFDVFVDAEENSECYVISGSAFADITEKYTDVKIFGLELAVSRFSDVMWVMQQILFMSMDKRLAIFLLDESSRTGSDTLELTHEQIARYIGSAREVVSRMLKYFSSEDMVEVSRKGIRITDRKKLRSIVL